MSDFSCSCCRTAHTGLTLDAARALAAGHRCPGRPYPLRVLPPAARVPLRWPTTGPACWPVGLGPAVPVPPVMAAPAPVVPIRPAATPSPRPVPRPKPHGRLVSPDQALQTWVRLRDDVVAFHDAGTPLSELEAMTAMSLRDIAEEFTIHATPIPGRISAAVRAHSRNRSAAVPRPA